MKKISLIILIITLVGISVGCGSKLTSRDAQGEYILEEVKELDNLPKDFKDQFDILSRHRGYSIIADGENQHLLFISLGEKRTGGYDIIGKGVSLENDQIVVVFEEIEPDGMAIQVISYPYKVFRLKGEIEDLNKLVVKNQHGEKLEIIDPEESGEEDEVVIQGEYVGKIDSHSVEIIVNGEAKAFEIAAVEKAFATLQIAEGDQIDITFEKNDNGQLVLKTIKRSGIIKENVVLPTPNEGTFMGREDAHSITVSVNKTIRSYQTFDMEDKLHELSLKEGDTIKFTYIEERNNLVIKSIEVLERAKKQ